MLFVDVCTVCRWCKKSELCVLWCVEDFECFFLFHVHVVGGRLFHEQVGNVASKLWREFKFSDCFRSSSHGVFFCFLAWICFYFAMCLLCFFRVAMIVCELQAHILETHFLSTAVCLWLASFFVFCFRICVHLSFLLKRHKYTLNVVHCSCRW